MFYIDDELTIHITRGDAAVFTVSAKQGENDYIFSAKNIDVVRLKVFEKKNCETVVLQKDVEIKEVSTSARFVLNNQDTAIGEVISKPKDYWYEVELNPDTCPQTIIGYDENGAKVFKLYPEGSADNE